LGIAQGIAQGIARNNPYPGLLENNLRYPNPVRISGFPPWEMPFIQKVPFPDFSLDFHPEKAETF